MINQRLIAERRNKSPAEALVAVEPPADAAPAARETRALLPACVFVFREKQSIGIHWFNDV